MRVSPMPDFCGGIVIHGFPYTGDCSHKPDIDGPNSSLEEIKNWIADKCEYYRYLAFVYITLNHEQYKEYAELLRSLGFELTHVSVNHAHRGNRYYNYVKALNRMED